MITAQGSRACPVCDATGYDIDGSRCRACDGTLWHPYPWLGTEDDGEIATYQNWTAEESAIVTAAPSLQCAIIGYYAVYGPTRTRSSIQTHRLRVLHDPSKRPRWTEAALETVAECPSSGSAVREIHARYAQLGLGYRTITTAWRAMNPDV